MGTLEGFLLALGWFLLRFGLPIALTVLVCWIFKRIDEKWKVEGEAYRKETGVENKMSIVRCWLFNNCPEEERSKCKAYLDQKIPCWQHFRGKNGELKQDCIGCGVFRGIPEPAIGD